MEPKPHAKPHIIMSGSLRKLKSRGRDLRNSWQRRWFVIQGDELRYSRSRHFANSHTKRIISLASIKIVRKMTRLCSIGMHVLQICAHNRVMWLRCNGECELNSWFGALSLQTSLWKKHYQRTGCDNAIALPRDMRAKTIFSQEMRRANIAARADELMSCISHFEASVQANRSHCADCNDASGEHRNSSNNSGSYICAVQPQSRPPLPPPPAPILKKPTATNLRSKSTATFANVRAAWA